MRVHWALLLMVPMFAGCLDAGELFGSDPDKAPCNTEPVAMTYWLVGEHELIPRLPGISGSTPSNSFSYAFVTNTADEWTSPDFNEGIRILGDVTLDLWIERGNAPALAGFGDNDTDGWQLFSQFGSSRGFAGSYHNANLPAAPEPGAIEHIVQTFSMPEGGLTIERRDALRLLMTNMGPDDQSGSNHDILWGNEHPSAISFSAVCFIDRIWNPVDEQVTDVEIVGNGGLLTGAGGTVASQLPGGDAYTLQEVPFTLDSTTKRLTIALEEIPDMPSTPKDDMDLSVVDAEGTEVWSIGSPYADEAATYWFHNLDALMPPGDYTVRVLSYSGVDYRGTLTVTQETFTP